MGMGDKQVMNLRQGNVLLFQDAENLVPSAAIHQKAPLMLPQDKARIIALRHRGLPGAQQRNK